MRAFLISLALVALPAAFAQQSIWGQCGGIGWSGPTICASGSVCVFLNNYHSQCQPVSATPNSTTLRTSLTSSSSTTQRTTAGTVTTTTPTRTTSSPSRTTTGATVSGSGPGSTLQPGYSWIRAVAAPNYHKYLQTSPLKASPGRAILADNKSAGQYKLFDGQLVELIDKTGTVLYANVGEQPNASATYLPVTFTTTKNTFGKFAFQGDTLTWSAEGTKRPNVAAWYVCEGKSLWINLGAYLYGTPAGCADQTIHSYGNSIADA